MSRPADNIPSTARSIALLLASQPSVQDAQPGVLHQLLEFSHRYTMQILADASVYADHAGRSGKIEMEDVVLAVQARVGWEFGGRVPKEYTLSLATQTNAVPLPAVPEVFGVRLPQQSDCLTSINFDLMPNKPPPGVKLYDEEVEEIEESESEDEDDDEDMEPAAIPSQPRPTQEPVMREEAPFPISAIDTSVGGVNADDGSDAADEDDDLFAGGEDEDDSDAMEEVQTALGDSGNGSMKRKLVEEDDYD